MFQADDYGWDVTPDGKRFLMIKPPAISSTGQVTVVLNWFEELRRRMPHLPRILFVQRIGVHGTNIISFENLIDHGGSL